MNYDFRLFTLKYAHAMAGWTHPASQNVAAALFGETDHILGIEMVTLSPYNT